MSSKSETLEQRKLQTILFPKEVIEFAAESYVNRIKVRSQLIYSTIIIVIIGLFASLPFIYVPVSTQSRGLIRSEKANIALVSPVTGKILHLYSEENDLKAEGDQIALIESPHLMLQEKLVTEKLSVLSNEGSDLQELLQMEISSDFSKYIFKTNLYQSEYIQCRREFNELNEQTTFDRNRLEISKSLLAQDLIPEAEHLKMDREYRRVYNRLEIFTEEKHKQWETTLHSVRQQVDQLTNDLERIESDKQHFLLRAPASGVVQQIESLAVGGFVSAGQTLATLSPRKNLIAEVFVSTRDIGLITQNTPVALQIDAFNHLEWGQINASITEISNDVYIINNIPMFRILCQMDRQSLTLKNGALGKLKKGLTFTARFEIANRSLFQLLRDQLDDWFSPYGTLEADRS